MAFLIAESKSGKLGSCNKKQLQLNTISSQNICNSYHYQEEEEEEEEEEDMMYAELTGASIVSLSQSTSSYNKGRNSLLFQV